MKDNKLAFSFASAEVSKIGQQFIKITELLTGKLILKKLYDQYLLENNPPENFWNDALKKLKLSVVSHYHSEIGIPKNGRLIVVANHAFRPFVGFRTIYLVPVSGFSSGKSCFNAKDFLAIKSVYINIYLNKRFLI